ncbi:MAG: hypothetical protein V1678_03700 [Candidatus Aenigmatarchaeota archaeon]
MTSRKSMKRALVISLSVGTDVFKIMNAYGANVDYIPSDGVRDRIHQPSVHKEFEKLEEAALIEGNVKEYFGSVQEMPNFWEKYVKSVAFLARPSEGKHMAEVDLERYDAIAVSALDVCYKPLESLLSYLDGACKKPVVVGGQIVRNATEDLLEKLPGRVFFNKGSLKGFLGFLEGKQPDGKFIGNGDVLRIDEPKILESADYVTTSTFNSKYFNKSVSGKPCAYFKVLGLAGCGNGCGYCGSPLPFSVPKNVWIDTIDRFNKSKTRSSLELFEGWVVKESIPSIEKHAYIDIADDNCFKNPSVYGDVISRVYDGFESIMINSYLDARNLISVPGSQNLLEDIVNNPQTKNVTLYVGRDCANEEGAKSLGRRFEGKIRSQAMLNEEANKLTHVFDMLDGSGVGYEAVLSYILGPGDENTIGKIEQDAMRIAGDHNGNIKTQILPLWAHPGTECYERYKHHLLSPFGGVSISNLDFENIEEFEKN